MRADSEIIFRRARKDKNDLKLCCKFVDDWLAGRMRAKLKMREAGNDYFVSSTQHHSYLRTCVVWLAFHEKLCIGWAVRGMNGVLIHLLVNPRYRNKGVGAKLLKLCNPDVIRSKSDQSTGDPAKFYEKQGYIRASSIKVGKKRNIELFVKKF